MEFPFYIPIGPLKLHPHVAFEALAYAVGLVLLYVQRRRRASQPNSLDPSAQLWILAGAVAGMLLGALGLGTLEASVAHWFGNAPATQHAAPGLNLLLGKTVVGGLLGGWLGVEIAKHFNHITFSTGDRWVAPLIISMAIGRIGCFLTGLDDHTYGSPSSLPFAVDFGDGIPRHPTQLYDIALLTLLGILLLLIRRPITARWPAGGALFRIFLATYLLYRFASEFIKPVAKPLLGLSVIQWACLVGAALCVISLVMSRKLHRTS